jgi:AcrR family transcriptional regulator
MPRRPASGRPPAVDGEAIARVVLSVGFSDLTFATVAARLGVGQATLYRHAPNRDELVRLGLDLALRTEEWPDLTGHWRPLLERWSIASWRAWERHPGAVIEAARGIYPPSIVALSDGVAAALVAQGFTASAAVLAVDLVFDLAADSRRGVESYDAPAPAGDGEMRRQIERQWHAPQAPDASAEVRAEMLRAIQGDPFDWFRRKLAVVLAGIAVELAPPHPSATDITPRTTGTSA